MLSEITIILPTYGRRERAQQFLRACRHRPLILVANRDRWQQDLPEDPCGAEVVLCDPNAGSVRAAEAGILACRTRLFFSANDDLDWIDGDLALEEAARVYEQVLGNRPGVCGMNDQIFRDRLACFALVAKEFYMKHIHPAPYLHYAVDDEWTAKAKRLGLWAYAENAVVHHAALTPRNEEWASHDSHRLWQRMREFEGELRR